MSDDSGFLLFNHEENIEKTEGPIVKNQGIEEEKSDQILDINTNKVQSAQKSLLGVYGIPVHQAPNINLSKLNSKNVVRQFSSFDGNDNLNYTGAEPSLLDLDEMSFDALAKWAKHSLRNKGDDYGQFAGVADSMFGISKLIKEIENTNTDTWAQMDEEDVISDINDKFEKLQVAVNAYTSNPKHKENPFFKKGKMRSKLCRQLLSKAKIDEYKPELILRARLALSNRKDKWLDDTAHQNYDQDVRDNLLKSSTKSPYIKEAQSFIDKQRLSDLNKKLNGKLDADGNQVQADLRSVAVLNSFDNRKKMYMRYGLYDNKNKKTNQIVKNIANSGLTKDIHRNIVLKPVLFDQDGKVISKYKENDLWNQRYISAFSVSVGKKGSTSEEDKQQNDRAYSFRKPYILDLYNEIISLPIEDMMSKWLDPDYVADNVDDIKYKMELIICFDGNILKDTVNRRFLDELSQEEKRLYDVMYNFAVNYQYYFMKSITSTMYVNPVDESFAYDRSDIDLAKNLKITTASIYDNLKQNGDLQKMNELKLKKNGELFANELRFDNKEAKGLHIGFMKKKYVRLLKKQNKGDKLDEDELEQFSRIPGMVKGWYGLATTINTNSKLLLDKNSNITDEKRHEIAIDLIKKTNECSSLILAELKDKSGQISEGDLGTIDKFLVHVRHTTNKYLNRSGLEVK